jgi:hypothetical protein
MFFTSFWKLRALVFTSKNIFWSGLGGHGWIGIAATHTFSSSIYHKLMRINQNKSSGYLYYLVHNLFPALCSKDISKSQDYAISWA